MLKRKNTRIRRFGVRPLYQRRREMGDGYNLINELRFESAMFYNYTRLNYERHLATGDSQASLSFAYRCGRATVSIIIRETLAIIVKVLHGLVINAPSNAEQWKSIANGFSNRWNLPHCLGAIDGRHMQIQCPIASGSTYFNYKKTFSVNLMAVASYDYSFIMVDVGAEGSLNDGAVFKSSLMGQKLVQKTLHLPEPELLPNSDTNFPFYFVGDGAFQLREDLMKPFAARKLSLDEAIYNYRLSRARRVVENAFAVLVSRWRLFRQSLNCSLQTADLSILAAVCLHNFIIRSREFGAPEQYMPDTLTDSETSDGVFVPGSWRSESENTYGALQPMAPTRHRNCAKSASDARRILAKYVNNEGSVEWQEKSVRQGFWGDEKRRLLSCNFLRLASQLIAIHADLSTAHDQHCS